MRPNLKSALFPCLLIAGALWHLPHASAVELPRPEPTPGHVMLPQEHQYQRQLRAYMTTLTEKDFAHGVAGSITDVPSSTDPEFQYRHHMLNLLGPPLIGSKRGVPSVNNPARNFLLSAIETDTAIKRPLVYPEALMSFVTWDYPGNVFRDNRALKLRCFVTATINMLMIDDFLDKNPAACRADWRAYQLIIMSMPYQGFKDELPAEVRQAYQEGLKKFARRMMSWGPKGEEPNLDMIIPVGLWYVSKACEDEAFSKEVENFARKMFTDPKYFHPAGYWVERGGLDTGFGGQANFFATWAALASDWPFAKEAVEKVYRLRAHLALPEPDGTVTGPAAFNTRLCSPVNSDQWSFGGRDNAALMLTDEAACWVKMPAADALANAAMLRAGEFKRQMAENPVKSGNGAPETPYVYFPSEELPLQVWRLNMFENWNFPASVNFAYEHYRKGAYAHLAKLESEKSPFLKFPFARDEKFVRDFSGAFVVAKNSNYGVVLHTGPTGKQDPNEGLLQYTSPMGFGGGQLSAFWTPATGSVILGRRGGMVHGKPFDKIEEWRTWPIHAVTGCTAAGKAFSSASIQQPTVKSELKKESGVVTVGGTLAPDQLFQGKVLDGTLNYTRVFKIESDGLSIESKITSTGQDSATELYETIPVYHRDAALQPKATPTVIELEIDDKWVPATENFQEKVTAVKLTRFDGAVKIKFDKKRRVKLSPSEWKDTVALSFASCRNVMIDLLPAGKAGEAIAFKEASVSYTISTVKK